MEIRQYLLIWSAILFLLFAGQDAYFSLFTLYFWLAVESTFLFWVFWQCEDVTCGVFFALASVFFYLEGRLLLLVNSIRRLFRIRLCVRWMKKAAHGTMTGLKQKMFAVYFAPSAAKAHWSWTYCLAPQWIKKFVSRQANTSFMSTSRSTNNSWFDANSAEHIWPLNSSSCDWLLMPVKCAPTIAALPD